VVPIDLQGRTALVTGASRGIGRAVAVRLAEAGARVVVHYRSDREGAQVTVDAIARFGEGACRVGRSHRRDGDPGDVRSERAVRCSRHPGQQRRDLPLRRNRGDDECGVAEVFAVNVDATFVCLQAAARSMAQRSQGAIVNVASLSALRPAVRQGHNNSSKAAVIALTRSAAVELAPPQAAACHPQASRALDRALGSGAVRDRDGSGGWGGCRLERAGAKTAAPSRLLLSTGRVLGRADHPGVSRQVAIATEDARHHFHVVGETGTGKSTLLANLVLQDAEAGRAAVVIDPKGDLVEAILERLPKGCEDRTCIVDPDDRKDAVGLNVLAGSDQDLVVVPQHVVQELRASLLVRV
jgi:NAD(P)-dependent dehydrogenase (short-subunit alcohol dehydrogenase family)